jgi:hypothetical protein
MAISTDLKENVVARAAVHLEESFKMIEGVKMNATADPGNQGDSYTVSDHTYAAATTVTPSSGNGPSTSADSFTGKVVTLDTWKNGLVTVDADVLATNNLSAALDNALKDSIRSCMVAVGSDLAANYTKIPYTSGTAGQSIFNNGSAASLDPMADVGKVLDTNLVDQYNRSMIVSPTEAANYRKITAVQNANQMGNDAVRRGGLLGMDMGFSLNMDQQTPSHTVGTITTGLIAKAATAVAAGATSFIGTTAATTGACALKKGDIISIAHASGARTYAVQADVTQASAATATAAITLDRGLEFALIGSEAVTIATGAGTGTQNIAGDLRGFELFSRIPQAMASGMTALQDPMVITHSSGLSLLMGYYKQNARTVWESSILFGTQVVQSELLVRAQGV